ncbi:chemotaxis protein CheC [Effusibacillus pohliae]|uniref:chemotaxis protein CheC n=1 Tax=Effusibacillus pohliae TaxID=232270 RepID=UPI000369BB9E|nr:chemotaxis protein CheC [Effusibacillus pohliae]
MAGRLFELDDFQLSVLREIGNIGAGHAATALSVLMQKHIEMNVPRVHVVSIQEIDEVIGGAEQLVVGVYLRVEGEIPGSMFLMLKMESANMLLQILTGSHQPVDSFSELEMSALMEVGNILAGSYLSAFSDFTKTNLHASVPAIAVDMAGALINAVLLHIGMYSDRALVVDTEFRQGSENVESHFFFVPDHGSVETIFKLLGVDFA